MQSPISSGWTAGRALLEKRAVHVHDLLSAEGDDFAASKESRAQSRAFEPS